MATKIVFCRLKYFILELGAQKFYNALFFFFFFFLGDKNSFFVTHCNLYLQFGDEKLFFDAQSNMFLQF